MNPHSKLNGNRSLSNGLMNDMKHVDLQCNKYFAFPVIEKGVDLQ